MNKLFLNILALLFFVSAALAQVPMNVGVQILKAEDARRYDAILENLMTSPNAGIRKRAALAAGRIGKEEAIGPLVRLMENDSSEDIRAMAAFALGEIESIKAADAVIKAIGRTAFPASERLPTTSYPIFGRQESFLARLVEAAGKIAAANAKDERSKQLGAIVLNVLEAELKSQFTQDPGAIRLGLTAVLRARPAGAEEIVRKFLAHTDPDIVATALNTLARLRAKNANRDARDLISTHLNAVVRANAARVLGAAEDKEAVDVLIKAATSDSDLRVRVSAIRALGSLKDAKVADRLFDRMNSLLLSAQKSRFSRPVEINELLEVSTTLGRLWQGSENQNAAIRFDELRNLDMARSSEIEVAMARIIPNSYVESIKTIDVAVTIPELDKMPKWQSTFTWQKASNISQGLAELANSSENKAKAQRRFSMLLTFWFPRIPKAGPDILRSYSRFKTDDLESILREQLSSGDVFVRATAAELLAEQPSSSGIRIILENAFKKALTTDKHENDAQLALLDAMAKVNKASALDTIYLALDAPDYLVRKKAFELLSDPELEKTFPGVVNVVRDAKTRHKDDVLLYDPKTGTKLGQVVNTDADYRRALSRKNGTVKAVVTTQKGTFTIDLLPEDAPLTVDNFVKLARANYFNGLEVHRVVPNFVMQDGDPRGDGNGGPGWSIRCEINMVPYERGAVGMALSGKDTGGSQWFVTHSPQPHLDGGYTVFGKVNDAGMKVVDNIVRGDKIVSIRIVESGLAQRPQRTQRK